MQTAIEQLMIALYEGGYLRGNGNQMDDILEKYKEEEKKQKMDFANWCRIHDKKYPLQIWTIQQLFDKYIYETYGSKGSDDKFDVLKEMFELEQQLDIPSHLRFHNRTSSQTEISDEEIEKFASDFYDNNGSESIFIMGAQWYREQLKKNI